MWERRACASCDGVDIARSNIAMPLRYPPAWMYNMGPTPSGAHFIRGASPQVLRLDLEDLTLPLKPIGGPPSLGEPAAPRRFNVFNPSIAAAPKSLCPRCAFVLSLRVDALHQCSAATTPYVSNENLASTDWFQGTAIAVLDAALALLEWTWLVNSPPYQIASAHAAADALAASRCTRLGASGTIFAW